MDLWNCRFGLILQGIFAFHDPESCCFSGGNAVCKFPFVHMVNFPEIRFFEGVKNVWKIRANSMLTS